MATPVTVPMVGKIIAVSVKVGDRVKADDQVAVLEAMKMENEIQSLTNGVVKKIHVSVGEFVDSERPLVEVDPGRPSAEKGGPHDG